MTSVLKPEILSIVNGLITVSVLSTSQVGSLFNQLLIFRASSASGPFTQVLTTSLTGADSYALLDASSGPDKYYKAQYYNSSTMVSSTYSELAQETGIYSEYSAPTSTATYPAEIALTSEDREIVESIRLAVGDMGSIERDLFDSSDLQNSVSCASQISPDGCTWELEEPLGWPRKIVLNGENKTSLIDPQILGYRFLVFSGSSPCITGTLDVFYNHFRFSDREILLAYDRAINLMLAGCQLSETEITSEMRIQQASILLLEGEYRDLQRGGAVRIKDGDTEYDNSLSVRSRAGELADFRLKLDNLIKCAVMQKSLALGGYRVD